MSTPAPANAHAGPSTPRERAETDLTNGMSEFKRPPFRPTKGGPSTVELSGYIGTFSHPVHFSVQNFFAAIKDLAVHPERNSALILRADPLPPKVFSPDQEVLDIGLEKYEQVRVRLMPKQVQRDGRVNQRITFYKDLGETGRGVVLMCPEVELVEDVPFYHPPVRKIAFIYEPVLLEDKGMRNGSDSLPGEEDGEGEPFPLKATISIAYLPFENGGDQQLEKDFSRLDLDGRINPSISSYLGPRPTKSPRKRSPLSTTVDETIVSKPPATILDANEQTPIHPNTHATDQGEIRLRIFKICKTLLERVYKHSYGDMVGYSKRVLHDVVVNKESFQDLYLTLKERHRHLDSRVAKAHRLEDVKRHVWKSSESSLPLDPSLPVTDLSHWGMQDVAIATFLMLLWKEMYPRVEPSDRQPGEEIREWDTWGRPPGGFVDLGCGNGLLVHILIAEGYRGKGYELRARKTWPNYPPLTRESLVEYPISFPDWFPPDIETWLSGDWAGKGGCPIKEDVFIIGNHADEITPWIPLLSLLPPRPVPYLSLPCCLHTLDGSFNGLTYDPPSHQFTPDGGFSKGLEVGASRYTAYLKWLGYTGLLCGWNWEKEGLRIPSTKSWGIIARHRWTRTEEEERKCKEWALEQVEGVRDRGLFKVREKEGKDTH